MRLSLAWANTVRGEEEGVQVMAGGRRRERGTFAANYSVR